MVKQYVSEIERLQQALEAEELVSSMAKDQCQQLAAENEQYVLLIYSSIQALSTAAPF